MANWWSRPLLPLTAALAAGITLGAFWGEQVPDWLLGLLSLVLFLLLALALILRLPLALPAVGLFVALGFSLATTALNPPLSPAAVWRLPSQAPLSLRGITKEWPYLRGGSQEIILAASAWAAPGGWQATTGLVLIRGLPPDLELAPGDEVVLRVRLAAPGSGPGAWSRKLALARQQIWVTGWLVPGWTVVKLAPGPTAVPSLSWRQSLQQAGRRILALQPEPLQGIYQALLLGDRSHLSPEFQQACQHTGTAHILAVSGLHLGLVAAVTWQVCLRLLGCWPWLLLRLNAFKVSLVLALGPMLFYAWLTGWSPSSQRAALMLAGGVLVLLLEYPRDFLALLALAAFLILVWSPLQLFALSFQLSFLAVAGIYFLYTGLSRPAEKAAALIPASWPWLQAGVRRSGQLLAVSLAATLGTLPVLLAAFQQFPTLGLAANLVVVPLVGLVVLPLGLLGLAAGGLSPSLGQLFFLGANFGLKVVLGVITWLAAYPLTISLPTPTWLQISGYYLSLGLLVNLPLRRWQWAALSLGLLAVLSPWLIRLMPLPHPALTLMVFGTSKELALAATLPDGHQLVVSAGGQSYPPSIRPPSRELLAYLHRQPNRRITHLVALTVTPANLGTLQALVRDFSLGQVYHNGDRPKLPEFWDWRNLLGDLGVPVRNLALAPLAEELGGIQGRSRQLRPDPTARPSGPALLELAYQGRLVLILPPAPQEWWFRLIQEPLPRPDLILLPADRLRLAVVAELMARLNPARKIALGSPVPEAPDWFYTASGPIKVQVDHRGLHLQAEAP